VLKFFILGLICLLALSIRLFAVVRYESVIHEFDPYFNFRTTKYLAHEGFLEFLNWFDDRGWFPLGRTIGGTIYPGLMLTAALIYWVLNIFNMTVNIRDVCVFTAPLFSSFAAIASYLLTTEVTKRSAAGLLAAAFTAIVPSYISRSVGGSYDNEGVAIFALIFTFYLWVKAVNTGSMLWASACALSYYYMVAAWGGYVFIINVIPIYTLILIAAGRYSSRLYVAYSVFYTMGSLMAMTVPFVGFNVIKQAETAGAHGVFFAVQVVAFLNCIWPMLDFQIIKRLLVTGGLILVGVTAAVLISMQLTGRLEWSGRSLTLLDPTYASKFLPIIASVSEHQPTTWSSFFFDLHALVVFAPAGLIFLYRSPSDASIFLILYGTISWYFAGVMVRLMLTLAPIACILGAIGISTVLTRFSGSLKTVFVEELFFDDDDDTPAAGDAATSESEASEGSPSGTGAKQSADAKLRLPAGLSILVIGLLTAILLTFNYHASFVSSMAYSSPSIVIDAGRMPDGTRVLHDDYREAYFWLRQNTDPESKILSWWDYGYQMSAMANRTVLVDNNTWNNTHIATVGRALATTEEKAYPILESLDVDYVLVIFGGLTGYSSDDINKFLWPVRIGSGVFPNDMPSENDYYGPQGFDIGPQGSPALLNCVAYKLCYYRFSELTAGFGQPGGFDRARNREVGVKNVKLMHFEEAFTSENWIVRIFKVKKQRTLNPTAVGARTTTAAKLRRKGKKKAPPARDHTSSSSGGSSRSRSSSSSSSSSVKRGVDHKSNRKVEEESAVEEEEKEVGEDFAGQQQEGPLDETAVRFVGCFGGEVMFGPDRVYGGGSAGAAIRYALAQAKAGQFRYLAIARAGQDGHSFYFNSLADAGEHAATGNMGDEACYVACVDSSEHTCGCADQLCAPHQKPEGEEHNRRWAVYEVMDG
jgi:dolichyl-diphosphooligosaccharide--protein glycosyltransferase